MTEICDLHVLVVPSTFPMPHSPTRGIFYRDQVNAVRPSIRRIGVVYPDHRRLKTLSLGSFLDTRFQTTCEREDGVCVIRHHGWNVPIRRWRKRVYRRRVVSLYERYEELYGEPDLVHAQGVLWAGEAVADLAASRKLPWLVTAHSSGFARGRLRDWETPRVRKVLREAHRVLAVSNYLRKELDQFVTNGRSIEVVPNVVDTDFFTLPRAARPRTPFRFLSVAHATKNKALDDLLRAFAHAFGASPDVELWIGGGGPQVKELRHLAGEMEHAGQVRFLGELSRTEVRDAMWSSHVVVLSSHIETFGVVLIEAMSTGLPVVATRSGGPEEVVAEASSWLVNPGDPAELADALVQARENVGSIEPERVRRWTIERYGYARFAELQLAHYQSVAEGS